MIEVLHTKKFLKSAKKLPVSQRKKLAYLLEILSKQPFSSLLHTKPLTGALTGFYSFRITREYRIIFQFINPKRIKLIDASHRRDIYR